jgi:hypothetical protein
MERINLSKLTYSASSLQEKTESFTFSMNDGLKKNENEVLLKDIKKVIPEVNFLSGKFEFILFFY